MSAGRHHRAFAMQPPKTLRPGEVFFALCALGFGIYAFREAYAISGFSGLTTGGVMPMAAAAVMIVSGLFILVDALRRRGAPISPLAIVRFLLPPRLILFVALILLYAASIQWLGFMLASSAFLFVAIALLWRRNVLWVAGITVVAMAVIYGLFRLVFQVVLPGGSLWT